MKHLSFVFALFLLGSAHAATVRSVPTTELGEPSMLGRYSEGRDGEVLVAAIPKNGALELWVIVKSRSNYSATFDFTLGTVTSLDGVLQVGEGQYEITAGVNGVAESVGFEVDVSDALRDLPEGGMYGGRSSRGGPARSTIEVERHDLITEGAQEPQPQPVGASRRR